MDRHSGCCRNVVDGFSALQGHQYRLVNIGFGRWDGLRSDRKSQTVQGIGGVSNQCSPVEQQLIASLGMRIEGVAGHNHQFSTLLQRLTRGDQAARTEPGFDDQCAQRQPRYDTVALGERRSTGGKSRQKFTDDQASSVEYSFDGTAFVTANCPFDALAQDGDRSVGTGKVDRFVDSVGQTADGDQAGSHQIAGELFGKSAASTAAFAGAHHGNAGLVEQTGVAQAKEDARGIGEGSQSLRVAGFMNQGERVAGFDAGGVSEAFDVPGRNIRLLQFSIGRFVRTVYTRKVDATAQQSDAVPESGECMHSGSRMDHHADARTINNIAATEGDGNCQFMRVTISAPIGMLLLASVTTAVAE